jgi:hypothetical protein
VRADVWKVVENNKEQEMTLVLRVITAGIGLWLLAISLAWMFAPGVISPLFGVVLEGAQGLNAGRGDLGGFFAAAGIFCFIGASRHPSAKWFLYGFCILLAAVAFGRVIGFLLDGPVLMTVVPFLTEIGFIVIAATLAGRVDGLSNKT